MLTPTITLLNPRVAAFGTTGISLQDAATSGAVNANGPPLTVTLGLPTEKLCFEDVPAVGRLTISSPAVMRPLVRLNAG